MRLTRIVGDQGVSVNLNSLELFSLRIFRWGEADLIEQLKKSTRHGRLCPLIENLRARLTFPGSGSESDYLISDKAV
jgi:hypothetical protein